MTKCYSLLKNTEKNRQKRDFSNINKLKNIEKTKKYENKKQFYIKVVTSRQKLLLLAKKVTLYIIVFEKYDVYYF